MTVLAPDPLWRGIERLSELTPFLARRWPTIDQVEVDEWSVLALLFPTHQFTFWGTPLDGWAERLPALTALSRRLVDDRTLFDHVEHGSDVVTVAADVWRDLAGCIDEVATLAASEV